LICCVHRLATGNWLLCTENCRCLLEPVLWAAQSLLWVSGRQTKFTLLNQVQLNNQWRREFVHQRSLTTFHVVFVYCHEGWWHAKVVTRLCS